MSTTAGRTNEGPFHIPFHIRKNSKHPRLVQLSKLAEDGGCLPFLTHAPQDWWEFGQVALPKDKIEHKVRRRPTQRWGCEG